MAAFASKNLSGFAEEIKNQLSMVTNGTLDGLKDNELFKNLEDILINKINYNENCILFCPIPSEPDYRPYLIFGRGQDNIMLCYNVLKEMHPKKFAGKKSILYYFYL